MLWVVFTGEPQVAQTIEPGAFSFPQVAQYLFDIWLNPSSILFSLTAENLDRHAFIAT